MELFRTKGIYPRRSHASLPTSSRCSGFTLVELLVTITIITVALGITMSGLSTVMKRSDVATTTNLICTVHRTLSKQARIVSAGTAIYGFSIVYAQQGASSDRGGLSNGDYFAYGIFPWWVEPTITSPGASATANWGTLSATRVGFKSAEDLNLVFGGSVLGTNTVSTITASTTIPFTNNYFFLFEDGERPWRKIYSTKYTSGTGIVRSTATLPVTPSAPPYYLHVAYEPGTGLMHAMVNTTNIGTSTSTISAISTGLLAGFPGDIVLNPFNLSTRNPNQIELLMCNFKNAVNTKRIVLYQNGNYEVHAAN